MSDNTIFCPSLLEAFASVAMTYPDKEIVPGKLARFPTNGKRGDTAGWCKLFPDGVGAVFGCNREGTEFVWQLRDTNAPPPSKQERQAARAKYEQARQQAERERADEHASAAATAANRWRDTCELDRTHDYVKRKGITPYCARQDKAGAVTLPVYGADGELQSLQFIGADGEKRFLRNGKMKGGRLFLGKPENGVLLVLVEGWATGCSIHEASGATVVICFFGSNLDDVAADLRRQFPESPRHIAADLDAHGKGLEYAQAAAAAGAPAIAFLPLFADGRDRGDFNDLHQAHGLDAVRSQINFKPDMTTRKIAPFIKPNLPKCDARDGTHDTRALTEHGNALRLLDANGDRLKYVHDAQSWLMWDNGAWHWDNGPGVRSLAGALPVSIYKEGAGHLNDGDHFIKWARKSQEKRTIDAAVAILADSSQIRLPLARVDADQFTIGFDYARQVINLHNGATRAATPADYITKSLSVNAIGDAAKAVRWVKFLKQVFSDDMALIDWLQRFTGYLLTGSTREQIFLFCFGHGANGKSVFIDVLKHIMGDYSRAIASETLSEGKRQAGGATPDLAALIGSRLVLCSETEDNTALAESLVKGLVSGDSMAVRQLYTAPVEFTPRFKLVMAGNHKPIVKGNDNGIWLVPFNRTFAPEERDPRLIDKLKTEAPHILAWMVAGCIAWQTQSLADTPAIVREATNEYQADQDLTGRWLKECTTPNANGETENNTLYANYKTWCADNGLHAASSVLLSRRLTERGYIKRPSNSKRFWLGLVLADSCNEDYARAKNGY